MKICWDSLEKLRYNSNTGFWYNKLYVAYEYVEECKTCREPFLKVKNRTNIYCSHKCQIQTEEGKTKIRIASSKRTLSEESRKKLGLARLGIKFSDAHKKNISKSKKGENHPNFGKHLSEETKKKISISNTGKKQTKEHRSKNSISHSGNKSRAWKGGYTTNNIPLYSLYASQLEWCEEVRQDPEDTNILQVKCTHCKTFFTPTKTNVKDRIRSINGNKKGESHFYCSDKCKRNCPVFKRLKYPKGFVDSSKRRADQKEWAELVKERDGYRCIRCGSTEILIAHHIEGLNQNPIESADIDLGVTVCKICDEQVHSELGCRRIDLQCK